MTDTHRGAREWRLYIVAAVAGVYVLAWSRVTPKLQVETQTQAPRAVWLDDLPAEQRPPVAPPTGWRVASRTETIAPIPRRVPSTNPPRIRTRSS